MNSIVQEQCVYTIVQYIYILIYVQYSYSRRIVSYTLYNSARIVSIYLSIYIAVQLLSCVQIFCYSYGLQPTRLLFPWGFPGKNTVVGCPFLLQGIFLMIQGLNLHLLHWQIDSLPLSHQGSYTYIHTHTHTHTPLHISLSRHTHTHLPIYLYLDPIVNTWFLFLSLLLSHLNISFRSHGSLPLIFQLASSKNKKFYIAIISCYM